MPLAAMLSTIDPLMLLSATILTASEISMSLSVVFPSTRTRRMVTALISIGGSTPHWKPASRCSKSCNCVVILRQR